MATVKPRVNVALEPGMYEALKRMAVAERRSMSNLVEGWIIQHLEEWEKAQGGAVGPT